MMNVYLFFRAPLLPGGKTPARGAAKSTRRTHSCRCAESEYTAQTQRSHASVNQGERSYKQKMVDWLTQFSSESPSVPTKPHRHLRCVRFVVTSYGSFFSSSSQRVCLWSFVGTLGPCVLRMTYNRNFGNTFYTNFFNKKRYAT